MYSRSKTKMVSIRSWLGMPLVETFNGLNISEMPMNSAYVTANTEFEELGVYALYDDCVGCPFTLQQRLRKGVTSSWLVDTSIDLTWRVMDTGHQKILPRHNRSGLLCQLKPSFGEYGVYKLDPGACFIQTELEPINSYLPVLLFLMMLFTVGCTYLILRLLYNCFIKKCSNDDDKDFNIKLKSSVNGITALHCFRGALLTMIIFLTTGGGGYSIVTRSWNGFSLAECIFYAFVWTVGFKIPLHTDEALNKGLSNSKIFAKILKRSAALIIIGSMIDSVLRGQEDLGYVTLWCPLQKLGIAYLVIASLYVMTSQSCMTLNKNMYCKSLFNLIPELWFWITCGFIFTLAVASMFIFASLNCQLNIGLEIVTLEYKIDVLETCSNELIERTNYFLIADSKTQFVNHFVMYTKGFLGTISTILFCNFGILAGLVQMRNEDHALRMKFWSRWGCLFIIGGLLTMGATYTIQINFWPLTSVFLISASSFFALTLTSRVIEHHAWFYLPSLEAFGATSLLILTGHQLFSHSLPFDWNITISNHFIYLLQNFCIISLWMIVAHVISKKGIQWQM